MPNKKRKHLLSKNIAAIVSAEDLALLREHEDRLDLAEMKKVMEEPGDNIPWEAIKKERLLYPL